MIWTLSKGFMEAGFSTISIYAHKSSGKTYTMQGGDTDDTKGHGTVPSTSDNLFKCKYSADTNLEIITELRLYMDQV